MTQTPTTQIVDLFEALRLSLLPITTTTTTTTTTKSMNELDQAKKLLTKLQQIAKQRSTSLARVEARARDNAWSAVEATGDNKSSHLATIGLYPSGQELIKTLGLDVAQPVELELDTDMEEAE